MTPITLNGWLRMRIIWPVGSASGPNSVSDTTVPSTATLAAPLTSCGAKKAPETAAENQTVLEVKNDSYLDHNIYLLQGVQRVRMGTARGLATTRFPIPRQYVFGVSALQFLADPIGSNVTPISERINVSEGDIVVLQIRGFE